MHRILKFLICHIVCSLCLCLSLSAAQLPGKNVTGNDLISLDLKGESLLNTLRLLETKSDYHFAYDAVLVGSIDKKITLKVTEKQIDYVLHILSMETGFDFAIDSKTITLYRSAESKPGFLTGKIADENGDPMPGINIKPAGMQIGTTSDLFGYYKLQLPAGTYTVNFSFLSYQTQSVTGVVITEGKNLSLNISMKPVSEELGEVTVTATYKKSSVESLYFAQRKNASVSNGLSADLISRTPDKNVGESLKRISGITTVDNRYIMVRGLGERYNGNMLNGQLMPSTELNRKNFNYDILPSSIVDNIVVVKTLTPDLSAEFGGGLVNVTIKDIPDEDFLQFSLGSSANDKTTGKEFRALQIDNRAYWAQVPGNRKLLGKLDWNTPQEFFDAYEESGKDASLFSNNWGLYKWTAMPSYNGQLSFGKTINAGNSGHIGILGVASYRHTLSTDDIRTGKDAWWGPNSDFTGSPGKSYTFNTTLSALVGAGYRNKRTSIKFEQLYLATYNQQLAIVDSGYNEYGNWGYNDITTQTTLWQSQLKGEYAFNNGIKVNGMVGYINLECQRPDNHFIISDAVVNEDDDSKVSIANAISSQSYTLRMWTRTKEKNLTWDANVTVPFVLAKNKQSVKAGYDGWYKDRMMCLINTYNSVNTSLTQGFYIPLNEFFSSQYGVSIDYNEGFNDGYHREAPLHAFYAMLDNRAFDKLRLVWGARAEYYDIDKLDNDSTSSSFYGKIGEKLNYFPSANLTYNLTGKMNLRLAYSRSVIRPDLRELSRFDEYDYELGGTYCGRALKYTFFDNYDFSYEFYPSASEVISLSAFYKHIDNPMEINRDISNRVFELSNSKEAINYGTEIEMRKNFAFTGFPVLKNITISGNAMLIKGKVRPMVGSEKNGKYVTTVLDWMDRLQQGASKYAYNFGLYYDDPVFSASVFYNALGRRCILWVNNYNENGQYYNYYEQPASSLDAQVAFRLLKNKNFEIKVNGSNLLNSYSLSYASYENREYVEGTDLLYYRTDRGRTCSLSVSYNF